MFKPFKSFKTLGGLFDGLNYLNPANRLFVLCVAKSRLVISP